MNTTTQAHHESACTQRNRALIEDLCSDCCPPGHYCTLKEITARSPGDARTLLMIKCIEKFKYERSQREGRDLGWNDAFGVWIQEGLADRFSRAYHPGIRFGTLYRAVMDAPGPAPACHTGAA